MGASGPHFQVSELACHHCGKNETQQKLVDALETFRAALVEHYDGMAKGSFPGLIVNDAYRCPENNAETPNAAKNSVHVQGLAADVRVNGMSARTLERIARGLDLFTGIGRDDTRQYLHVDLGENIPPVKRPASWCYDSTTGNSVTYYA